MNDDLNICKICDTIFATSYAKSKHLKIHKISYRDYIIKFYFNGVCPTCKCGCGKIMPFRHNPGSWFRDYASNHGPKLQYTKEYIAEWQEKTKKTNLKKYGKSHYTNREKAKNTSKILYGDEYYNNTRKIKETKLAKYGDANFVNIDKARKTKLENYGDENYTNRQKSKNTLLKNYGVDSPSKSNIIVQKAKSTRFSNFLNSTDFETKMKSANVIPCFSISNYFGAKKNKYKFKCMSCNTIFYDDIDNGRLPRCLKCHPYKKSNAECELIEYIKSIYTKDEVLHNNSKILQGKELDIYLPAEKLAIEMDGLIWHSELFGKKDRNYHLNKTEECRKLDINLILLFEDEWLYKKDIVKSKLHHMLGLNTEKIYARNCQLKEISNQLKNDFLSKTHLQGTDMSSVKIGAYYNDELVAVMTFGKLRIALGHKTSNIGEYELMRFSTSKNIVGIASKLLSYFIKNYTPIKIISYADRRWSIGNVYEKIGFKKVSDGIPNYWYIDTQQHRFHRFGFRKSVLQRKLKIFDANLTEWENMQLNKYDRIWDCGNIKYEMILNKL